MGKIGWLEIILIAILVLILFGHSKIPELAKNLASGINVFKKELKGKDGDKGQVTGDREKSVSKKSALSAKPVAKKSAPPKKSIAKKKK
jgi:sec-independent protein translocase protein TatA